MRLITVEARTVGLFMADADHREQAIVLNEFFRELTVRCRTPQRLETQLCDIASELDDKGIRLVKELHEFVLLREASK